MEEDTNLIDSPLAPTYCDKWEFSAFLEVVSEEEPSFSPFVTIEEHGKCRSNIREKVCFDLVGERSKQRMDTNEMEREIYAHLKRELAKVTGAYIILSQLFSLAEKIGTDMPVVLQGPAGQAAFRAAVWALVEEKQLTPVGKSPRTVSGLHVKYKVVRGETAKEDGLAVQIVREILPPAKVDYYIKKPQDFIADRELIRVLCDCARKKTEDWLTVNERAYELFGDEKFFKGGGKDRSRGEVILKRLGLDFSDVGCLETVEPFFSFQHKEFYRLPSRKIYIIENKDTFWSFKRQVMDKSSRLAADMLVYGEGRKILSSFTFMTEYESGPGRDAFFYFGDLDPEGINLYGELITAYPGYTITPFYEGYQELWRLGSERAPIAVTTAQKLKEVHLLKFLEGFSPQVALAMRRHLEEGFYIPQEALSAREMRKRFGRME